MPARPIKLPSDGVMAEVRLGVAVTGLYTLVGMGLVIAFMRPGPVGGPADYP